jgi:predicted ferric reductase
MSTILPTDPGPRRPEITDAAVQRPIGWIPAYGRWHRRWRARRADLMEALALASVVGVVAAFLARGGAAQLSTTGAILVAVGQVVGLVVTDLLLIQLLLASRVPWVDRVYGMDRALKAHRILGRVTIPMVLVHAGALVAGYAAQDGLPARTAWLVEPGRMLTGVPDMVTASIATVLLVVVAVTSVRLARDKIGYERWHLVHLTAYAAVILAIPHELHDGTDIATHRLERTYWLALYLLVAVSLVWWRLLVPLVRSIWHAPYVERVVPEAPGVWSVWIRGRRLDAIGAQAGQYFTWRFMARGLLLAGHPWSLSAKPGARRLRITVREMGDHSNRLQHLRPGTRVLIEGPYGAFTAERRQRRRVALLAAGIGITPVRALAEELCTQPGTAPGDVTLIYRGDSSEQLALGAELAQLAEATGLTLHFLVGPPVPDSWFPESVAQHRPDGRVALDLVPDLQGRDVYVCGPAQWMDLVHASLRTAGVPRSQVHDERFAW